jgi:hypothetical protein
MVNKSKKQATHILNSALNETVYLRYERVVRCIIFLAEGSLKQLRKYTEAARQDTRDVMFWAEYIHRGEAFGKSERVRDFNNRFDQNDLTIREE